MSALRQLLKSAFSAALPQSWLMTRGPRVSVPHQTEIALTFDDGPHPEHTPRLLDLLAASGAKGTFFVIGEQTLRHPKLVRRMVDEGHEIGNHTWTHSEPSQTSAVQFLEEVTQTRRMIQNLTGRDCRLMRPPKGALTVGKTLGLWRRQQTIALWNSDPKDFAMTNETELFRWLDGYHPRTGDIVLLHDNHPRAAVAVERLTNNGLRFVTLSEWLVRAGPQNVTESLRDSGRVAEQLGHKEVANVL
ncbi:MAG: polysaccharide deacetylase family protein [Planctomycetaceae bacterium]|nr:polysaccharide deacetylase family protein [Planctomycetaceae bacterium]